MFLEMIDTNRNEMILYSKNKFDPESNFTIILKDQFTVKRRNISYNEAYKFLQYPLRKNLILYRLISNYSSINSADSKFGFILLADGREELFYFDPIYALKDLPGLVKDFNLDTFRFRIQQVGLKTIDVTSETERFTETYCYDLHAVEAEHQNDEVFAEALIQNLNEEREENNKPEPVIEPVVNTTAIDKEDKPESVSNEKIEYVETIAAAIKEVEESISVPVSKPIAEESPRKPIDKSEQKELLKKILGIDSFDNQEPIKLKVSEMEDEKIDFDGNQDFSNLFRSTRKPAAAEEREKDTITLRLTLH